MSKFCRARQQWSHKSESLPEVGVLYSGRTLYRTAGPPFGGWGEAEAPAAGALELLLSLGYSADLIPDWQAAESAARYPLIVVPDWKDMGSEVAATLAAYAAGGGRLLLCGAENTRLFSKLLGYNLAGPPREQSFYVADATGFAVLTGNWQEIDASQPEVAALAWRTPDTRKPALPLGLRMSHGKGTVVVCPGPLSSAFGDASSPILRAVAGAILKPLHRPMVRLYGDFPSIETVLRKKDGYTLVHLINLAGVPDTGQFRHTGVVPPPRPIRLSIRLASAPASLTLEPEGTALSGVYKGGEWNGLLPDLNIHALLRIEGGG